MTGVQTCALPIWTASFWFYVNRYVNCTYISHLSRYDDFVRCYSDNDSNHHYNTHSAANKGGNARTGIRIDGVNVRRIFAIGYGGIRSCCRCYTITMDHGCFWDRVDFDGNLDEFSL